MVISHRYVKFNANISSLYDFKLVLLGGGG